MGDFQCWSVEFYLVHNDTGEHLEMSLYNEIFFCEEDAQTYKRKIIYLFDGKHEFPLYASIEHSELCTLHEADPL